MCFARENRKADYLFFANQHPDLPIFLRPWWLDADARNERWDVALYYQNGQVVGAMPYCFTKLKMFRGVGMPPLAPYQGFYLATPKFPKKASREKWERNAVQQLVEQLPSTVFFYQKFLPEIRDWSPFYPFGYRQTTRYSHVLPDISDLNQVYYNFEKRAKHIIRKAEKKITVKTEWNPNLLSALLTQTFEKQGLASPYPTEKLNRIITAIYQRKCGAQLVARDAAGQVHAASLLVWERGKSYYLVHANNPKYLPEGGASLLIWEAIRHCSERGIKAFDFTGSMMPGISLFLRSFGAERVPYHYVSKENTVFFYWLMRGKNFFEEQRRCRRKALIK